MSETYSIKELIKFGISLLVNRCSTIALNRPAVLNTDMREMV